MVPILALWLPILVAAVIVFLASSLLHMALPYHRSDYRGLPHEGDVADAMRKAGVQPGDYMMPYCSSMSALKDPAVAEKFTKGPIAVVTVMRSGMPSMGPQLAQWFVYCAVVGVFAAYIAGRALGPGAHYLAVPGMAHLPDHHPRKSHGVLHRPRARGVPQQGELHRQTFGLVRQKGIYA